MILPKEQRRELGELGKAILRHIVEQVETTAVQPTLAELTTRFAITTACLRDELATMAERGWIERADGANRAIQIPRDVREMFARPIPTSEQAPASDTAPASGEEVSHG